MAELIRDGQNGYLVDSIDGAVRAVESAAGADPKQVRASVERRFDVSRMVDEYIAVYHRVLALGARQ